MKLETREDIVENVTFNLEKFEPGTSEECPNPTSVELIKQPDTGKLERKEALVSAYKAHRKADRRASAEKRCILSTSAP